MRDSQMVLVVLAGVSTALGLFLLGLALVPRPARLSDALALMDGQPPTRGVEPELAAGQDWATRFGSRLASTVRLSVPEATRRTLSLQGRTTGDYVTEKFLLASLGLVAPLASALLFGGLGVAVAPVPVGLSLGCAALGWFYPDLKLRQARQTVSADAAESLYTFFDLVALERLSNQSASQALASAATISDGPIFLRVRAALERARLEQRPPWRHLHSLAEELGLPEIADIADVMRLDEQGAALAEPLRARVKELRDAHLLREKVAAQQVSERMTLWMVLPSMVFGLIFLTPPLLRIAGYG